MRRIRNVPPGMYNERRLLEQPIPDDESGLEESFEEILIPEDLSGDGSLNSTLHVSPNPLNISSDGNASMNAHDNDEEEELPTNEVSVAGAANNRSTSSENHIASENSVLTSNSNASQVPTNNDFDDDTRANGVVTSESTHREQLIDGNAAAQEIFGNDSVQFETPAGDIAENIVSNQAIDDNSLASSQSTQQITPGIGLAGTSGGSEDNNGNSIDTLTTAVVSSESTRQQLIDENVVAVGTFGNDSMQLQAPAGGTAENIVSSHAIDDNSLAERSSSQSEQQITPIIGLDLAGTSSDFGTDNDMLVPESENATSNDVDPNEQVESKPVLAPLYQIYRANNNHILQHFEEYIVDYVDDDVEIAISAKGYGAPLNTTLDGLVKPEKPDDFSGWMPSLKLVCH